MATVRCKDCGEEKDESDFWRNPGARNGLQPWCKPCQKARHRADYRKYREKRLAYQRQYDREHREQARARGN